MISIIICSRKADISNELKQNIAATIGCEYEVVVINNAKNDYTIFTAYNEGVRRAKGDVLCFMHEDIIFRSADWGQRVVQMFADNSIGCIGVIGSWFLPQKEASWWFCNAFAGELIQGEYDKKGNYRTFVEGEKVDGKLKDVVVIDGCWFCIPKALFKEIRFDDHTFDSFHCYDVDICMQVLNVGKRVVVCSDIRIEHQSGGNVNATYFDQLSLFHKKWEKQLPICKGMDLTPEIQTWVGGIIHTCQNTVRKNVMLENSRRYRLVNRIRDWLR